MLEFCAYSNQNRNCKKHLKSNNRQIAILSFVCDGLELVRRRIYNIQSAPSNDLTKAPKSTKIIRDVLQINR